MDLWRKAAIAIIFSIPAIIGGGLAWALSENWIVVFTFLGFLGFFLVAWLFNPEGIVSEIPGEKETEETAHAE